MRGLTDNVSDIFFAVIVGDVLMIAIIFFWRSESSAVVISPTSCAVLCRQQFIKPNREVYKIGRNLNLGLGEVLLAAALHDEGDTASSGFHGATAVEYMHKMFPWLY